MVWVVRLQGVNDTAIGEKIQQSNLKEPIRVCVCEGEGGMFMQVMVASSSSTELALPRGPYGVKAPVLARGQLAELIERLLGELEDVVGDSQGVVVVKDGKEVVRVDASTRRIRHKEHALAGRSKCVNVKVAFTLVVWSRCWKKKNEEKMSYLKNDRQKKNGRLTLHNHHPTLNESNRNRTVAQHGKDGWDECLGGWATTGLGMRCT